MASKIILLFVVSLVIAIYGCSNSSELSFNEGIKKIDNFDKQFEATIKIPPNSTEGVEGLLAQLTGFRASNNNLDASLVSLLDFRIKSLEAEELHIEGWKDGRGSTTDWGFGCNKGSARVLNSSSIRNASAQKGFEAVDALQSFIENHPKEAESLNLGQKDILFLNAAYLQIEEKANKDYKLITELCKEQVDELREEGVI